MLPRPECIGKGKPSAPYEFGVKASIVTTNARAPGGGTGTGTYRLELQDLGSGNPNRFNTVTFELNNFGANAGGWSDQEHYPRMLGDVNGDGLADIVAFGANGVNVSLATFEWTLRGAHIRACQLRGRRRGLDQRESLPSPAR